METTKNICFIDLFVLAAQHRQRQTEKTHKHTRTTKRGGMYKETKKENVRDALLYYWQPLNVALLVPLVGGLLLVLFTGRPPQGPSHCWVA